MKSALKIITWSTGIAIFSMFFGAGNVIFPIILGQESGGMLPYAIFGLLITAIGGPLLGLFAAVLFEGDSKKFYWRIGEVPGAILVILLLALIGPFAAMPRCVTVAYASIEPYFPGVSLLMFSILAGLVVLAIIAKRELILPILGYVLSPILIISLLIIILKGLFGSDITLLPSQIGVSEAFSNGLETGYSTMDLLASIFFSAAVWNLLSEELGIKSDADKKVKLVPICLWASAIGGISLGLVYLGLSVVAGSYASSLAGVDPEQMLSKLAILILGDKLSIIANIAMALACLTTVISLAVTIADVIHNEVDDFLEKRNISFNYYLTIFIITAITVAFSNIGFDGLMTFIVPIISICYPAIIVLTVCNVLYKLFGFNYVKIPFFGTLLLTIVYAFV